MRAISLFSGAGGMDVGFKNAGFEIVAANELDKHACNTFRANHPDTALFAGDIDECGAELNNFENIDVVFGGPPCQGFSVAGKMDPDDPRSKLIFSFCSIVESLQPKAFVMENVKSLGSLAKFEGVPVDKINAGPELTERAVVLGEVKKQYKAINKAIDDYLPGREGKSGNRGCYIQSAKMLRKKIFPEIKEDIDSNIWNTNLATSDKQGLRADYEDKLVSFLEMDLVRDWDHLKELINQELVNEKSINTIEELENIIKIADSNDGIVNYWA